MIKFKNHNAIQIKLVLSEIVIILINNKIDINLAIRAVENYQLVRCIPFVLSDLRYLKLFKQTIYFYRWNTITDMSSLLLDRK